MRALFPTKRGARRFRVCHALLAVPVFVVLGCGAAPQGRVPYVIRELTDVVAPELPETCDGRRPDGRLWVLFMSEYCDACRDLETELESDELRLRGLGVEVVSYSIDAESCFELRGGRGGRGAWAVGVAGFRSRNDWAIRATPTLFFLERGRVTAVVRGQAPVDMLLEAQRCIDVLGCGVGGFNEI